MGAYRARVAAVWNGSAATGRQATGSGREGVAATVDDLFGDEDDVAPTGSGVGGAGVASVAGVAGAEGDDAQRIHRAARSRALHAAADAAKVATASRDDAERFCRFKNHAGLATVCGPGEWDSVRRLVRACSLCPSDTQ